MKSSIESIINPGEGAAFSVISVIILGVSIVIKCLQSLFYRKVGKLINSTAVMATSVDSLNDCISTGAVLVASIVSLLTFVFFSTFLKKLSENPIFPPYAILYV